MREWIEMRVGRKEVLRRLPQNLGRELYSPAMLRMLKITQPDAPGGVRRIDLPRDSPLWDEILEIYRDIFGDPYPHYVAFVHFRYTKAELLEAEALRLRITRAFEPVGESCGTVYDTSAVCPGCGAGRVQASDLHLKLSRESQAEPKLPRTRRFQIARTIRE